LQIWTYQRLFLVKIGNMAVTWKQPVAWTAESDALRMCVWTRNVLGVSRRAMPEAWLREIIDFIGGGSETV
jgi:hypothetical protein